VNAHGRLVTASQCTPHMQIPVDPDQSQRLFMYALGKTTARKLLHTY
jgi:hypothetical protein